MINQKIKYKKHSTDVNKLFYYNSKMEKITVFTPYKKIIKEFNEIGIETADVTLEQLLDQLSLILLNEYCKNSNKNMTNGTSDFKQTEYYNKVKVLMYHVKEVSYNIYNYKENKMPKSIRTFYKYR